MKTGLALHRSVSMIVSLCAALVISAPALRPVDAAASRAALTDLHSVDELKALFDTDVGKTRLVLLVSPT